ncbi:MAG: 50S ribosomal protein L22 [bacterium]|nr:50S ribosomal protein L22 [bacterium]
MEVTAISKQVKISPRKIRLVADSIRNLPIDVAINSLSLTLKKSAAPVAKTLKSAIANAVNNAKLDRNNLILKRIEIDSASALKRYKPSTRGRTHPFKRRSSNIRIILEEKQ